MSDCFKPIAVLGNNIVWMKFFPASPGKVSFLEDVTYKLAYSATALATSSVESLPPMS